MKHRACQCHQCHCNPQWDMCPCGHAAALHSIQGGAGASAGCRSKDLNFYKTDCYGYCPCPSSRSDVTGGAS